MEPGWETIILELTSVVVTETHADGDIKQGGLNPPLGVEGKTEKKGLWLGQLTK